MALSQDVGADIPPAASCALPPTSQP